MKEKLKQTNLSRGRNLSTFAAHVIEQDLFCAQINLGGYPVYQDLSRVGSFLVPFICALQRIDIDLFILRKAFGLAVLSSSLPLSISFMIMRMIGHEKPSQPPDRRIAFSKINDFYLNIAGNDER